MKTIIKEFILKYLEPKAKYDGISADELADMLTEKLASSPGDEQLVEELKQARGRQGIMDKKG